METVTHVQWQAIEARLKTPFPPQEVHFRLQGTPREVQGKLHGQVVAYVDARAVMNRLDEVVGPENWSFRWEPIAVVNGKVTVAKGSLSLYDLPPKEDVGDSGEIEPNKSAVSDALKRAAVLWGIARYLYEREAAWVEVEPLGPKNWRIPKATVERLRASLPRPEGRRAAPASASQPQPTAERWSPPPETPTQEHAPATPTPHPAQQTAQPASKEQLQAISKLCASLGREEPAPDLLTEAAASALIRQLSRDYNARRPNWQAPIRDLTPTAEKHAG